MALDILPNAIGLPALFPIDLEIRLFAPLQRSPEALPVGDLIIVNSFVRLLRARLVIEFGTARGRTAVNLALNASEDAEIVSIDVQRHVPQYEHGGARVTKLVVPSREFDDGPYRGRADFVFVDGSHEYQDVLSDSRKALDMVRPGGVVLWHDYHSTQAGVTQALHEVYESDRRFHGLTRILRDSGADSSLVYFKAPTEADRLEATLIPLVAGAIRRCRKDRVARVFLFGAGPHTDAVISLWTQQGGPAIQGILTSEPPAAGAGGAGLPFVATHSFEPAAGDGIVLSSQTFEFDLANVCRRLWPEVACYALFDAASSDTVVR